VQSFIPRFRYAKSVTRGRDENPDGRHPMQPGRPRIYRTNAERKRAWRQRQQPTRARKSRPKTNAERQRAWRKRQKIKVYHRRQTIEWETPQDLFDELQTEFPFMLDVAAQPGNAKCSRYFTPEDNGLEQPWEGVCWMNPPYGRPLGDWMRKAYESALQGGATVVCLVPALVISTKSEQVLG
jgi:DNA N-6-adenine-methyltransferase (Dam)